MLDRFPNFFMRGRINIHGIQILSNKIEIAQDIMIKDGDIAARLIRDIHIVPIFDQLAKESAGGNHIVIGVRAEQNNSLAVRELMSIADFMAQHSRKAFIQPVAIVIDNERGKAVRDIIVRGEFEDGFLQLLCEPDDGAEFFRGVWTTPQPPPIPLRSIGGGVLLRFIFGGVVEGIILLNKPRRFDAGKFRGGVVVEMERNIPPPFQGGGRGWLQQRGRKFRCAWAFDGPAHHVGFIFSKRGENNFARSENGRYAHRDGFARHVRFAKEIGRGIATREGMDDNEPRASVLRRPRLVESDMSAPANAEKDEIESSGIANGAFIRLAISRYFFSRKRAIGNVNMFRLDIYMLKQMLLHEAMIALQRLWRNRIIFVEVERPHLRKIEAGFVQRNEFAVNSFRRRAGRQAENGVRFFADERGDALGHGARERGVIGMDDDGKHRLWLGYRLEDGPRRKIDAIFLP